MLGNTYHLMLRPGAERVASLGGLHRFMDWPRSDPDRFRRLPGHVAGEAAQARRDRCHLPVAYRRLDASADARARDRDPASPRLRYPDAARRVRELPASEAPSRRRCTCRCAGRSAAASPSANSPGGHCSASCRAGRTRGRGRRAAGARRSRFQGLCDRRPRGRRAAGQMLATIETVAPRLPAGKPRYLMGVGTPDDIVEAVSARHRHVRLRAADARRRHGTAYTRFGRLNLRNAKHADDPEPIDAEVEIRAGKHLFEAPICITSVRSNEILGMMPLTGHQPRLLPRADGGSTQGDRRRPPRGFRRRDQGRPGRGRATAAMEHREIPADHGYDISALGPHRTTHAAGFPPPSPAKPSGGEGGVGGGGRGQATRTTAAVGPGQPSTAALDRRRSGSGEGPHPRLGFAQLAFPATCFASGGGGQPAESPPPFPVGRTDSPRQAQEWVGGRHTICAASG